MSECVENRWARAAQQRKKIGGCLGNSRVWSADEERLLVSLAGSATYDFMIRTFKGRTINALRSRARKLGISLDQGTWTLNRIINETGYNWKQIHRAKSALGQRWNRTVPGRSYGSRQRPDKKGGRKYLISDDQATELLDYLKDEPMPFFSLSGYPRLTWSTYHKCCVDCGINGTRHSERHYGRGLCVACAKKHRKRALLEDRMQIDEQAKTSGVGIRWTDKNVFELDAFSEDASATVAEQLQFLASLVKDGLVGEVSFAWKGDGEPLQGSARVTSRIPADAGVIIRQLGLFEKPVEKTQEQNVL